MTSGLANPTDLTGHPLQGVKVLDLGQIYNGPYAGFLLAMAGADVIKVEPINGEAIRDRSGRGGVSLAFGMLNSNKRDIAIDLKTAKGRALLVELAKEADILLENFAPGALDRLGIGAAVLQAANPRLIYASSTGYGLSGPSMDNLAMDLTIQANAGVMSVNGPGGGPPMKAGVALCDFFGGVHLYCGILTALYERGQTGRGRIVEIAMLEAVYPVLASNLAAMHQGGGVQPPRRGNQHPVGSSAPYGVYETTDGHVAIICVREVHWQNLLKLMDRGDLTDDPRFIDQATRGENNRLVDSVVQAWTCALSKDEVSERLRAHQVPGAAVRGLAEVIEDAHMHERGMLHRMDHPEFGPVVLPHSPLRFHGEERVELVPSPNLGQHSREVLADWLDLDPSRVDDLIRSGAVGEQPV